MTAANRTSNDPLATLRRTLADASLLDAETERELVCAAGRGDKRATDRLVKSHLRLVVAIAREHLRFGVCIEDLVGEGSVGLMKAVQRFDPARNTRFAAYAAWWIRAYIREFTLRNRRIVAMPATRAARKVTARLRPTEAALSRELGHEPSEDEVAEVLGVSPEDVRMVRGALGGRDVPVAGEADGGASLVDGCLSPEDQAAEKQEQQQRAANVQAALAKLSVRERYVVRRHVLVDEDESYATIGKEMGLSRERIRQIEHAARHKLRSHLDAA